VPGDNSPPQLSTATSQKFGSSVKDKDKDKDKDPLAATKETVKSRPRVLSLARSQSRHNLSDLNAASVNASSPPENA